MFTATTRPSDSPVAATGSAVGSSRSSARSALVLAWAGIVCVLAGVIAILVLHVVSPTAAISPLRRTISEYAYTSLGWVFDSAVIAISVGSLLITGALAVTGTLRRRALGPAAMLAWSFGLVLLVIFPKHDWSVGLSGHGTVHRIASLLAFMSIPIAAMVIGRGRQGRLRAPATLTLIFGAVAAAWLACIMSGFVIGPLTGTRWWLVFPLGLMERGMAFFGILSVLSLGWLSIRSTRAVCGPARPGHRLAAAESTPAAG